MPKSRHRKNRKAYKPRRAKSEALEVPPSALEKPSLRRALLENDADLLFQIVTFLPLVFGTWLTGGSSLPQPGQFMVLIGVSACAHYLHLVFTDRLPLFATKHRMFALHLAGGAFIALFFALCRNVEATLLLICWWVLAIASFQVQPKHPRAVILLALALIARVSLIAILGAFSQFPELVWSVGTLGFVPGTYLAAALVARHAQAFEAAGWKRNVATKDKTGKSSLRPGPITQLFALLLILGPVTVMSCFPFHLLPETLLICALPLYFMPGAASAFLERLRPDPSSGIVCIKLALLSGVLAFVGWVLAVI